MFSLTHSQLSSLHREHLRTWVRNTRKAIGCILMPQGLIFEAEKTYMVIQLINGPGRVSQWAFGKVEKALIQWGLKKCSCINHKRKTTLCFLSFLRSRSTEPHPRLIIFLFDKPTGKVGLIHTSIPRKKFKLIQLRKRKRRKKSNTQIENKRNPVRRITYLVNPIQKVRMPQLELLST